MLQNLFGLQTWQSNHMGASDSKALDTTGHKAENQQNTVWSPHTPQSHQHHMWSPLPLSASPPPLSPSPPLWPSPCPPPCPCRALPPSPPCCPCPPPRPIASLWREAAATPASASEHAPGSQYTISNNSIYAGSYTNSNILCCSPIYAFQTRFDKNGFFMGGTSGFQGFLAPPPWWWWFIQISFPPSDPAVVSSYMWGIILWYFVMLCVLFIEF